PQVAVGDVQRDAADPGREQRVAAELRQRTKDAQERLLEKVLVRAVRPQHAVQQAVDAPDLLAEEARLRGAVTRRAAPHELALGVLGGPRLHGLDHHSVGRRALKKSYRNLPTRPFYGPRR